MRTVIFYTTYFFSFIFSYSYCYSQLGPAIVSEQCYGGSKSEFDAKMKPTADGGHILIGSTGSNDGDVSGFHGTNYHDAWVAKLDSLGAIEWEHCFGGTSYDYGRQIIQTSDGGYLFAAYIYSDDGDIAFTHGSTEMWVVKLDAQGNISWQRSLGGSSTEGASSIIERSNGSYLALGFAYSIGGDVSGYHGSGDTWLVNLDQSGSILWQHCYGGSGTENPGQVYELNDGNLIIMGSSSSNNGDVSGNHGGYDGWVVKADAAGNILWQHSYGGTGSDDLDLMQETATGFIFCGTTTSNDGDVSGLHGGIDTWIVNTDGAGNILNQKCLGGSLDEYVHGMVAMDDGGMVVAGGTYSADGDVTGNHGGAGSGDGWLVRTDVNFQVLWSRCYGSSGDSEACTWLLKEDEKFFVALKAWYTDGDVTCTDYHGNGDILLFRTGEECLVPIDAAFTSQNTGLSFQFTDQSTNASSWLWNFGDGTTTTDQNPSHTFSGPGIYQICLTVFDSCGVDSTCITVNTCGAVTADYTYLQNGLTFSFTDASVNATSWLWKFKTGATSTQQNPSYTYSQPGIYDVQLIASNSCLSDTISKKINTCGPLLSSFGYNINNLTVDFTNLSVGNITMKTWYFGDGTTSNLNNPVHTYAVPGNYNVSLTVWSDCEYVTSSQTINVCVAVQSSFTFQQTGSWLEFTNTSSDANSYSWDFGDGNTSVFSNPTYYFMQEGSYDVCLTAINVCDTQTFCTTIVATQPSNPGICWTALYSDGTESDFSSRFAGTDSLNNVYVCGTSDYVSGYYNNMITIKYDADGNELWVQDFSSGTANDRYKPMDMESDESGNVYIIFTHSATGRWGLVKYNSDGQQDWVIYAVAGNNENYNRLALDEYGNIFIGGEANGNYLVAKYHQDSIVQWTKDFDYGYHDNDVIEIACGPGGVIFLSGICVAHSSGSQWDGVTVSYDSSGNYLGIITDDGTTSSHQFITTGYDGVAYILGTNSNFGDYPEFYLHKSGNGYNWVKKYTCCYDETFGIAMGADGQGNVYLLCKVLIEDDPEEQYTLHLLKYNAGGNLLWNKALIGANAFMKMVVNENGDLYLTGRSPVSTSNSNEYNIATAKLNSDGVAEWMVLYDQAGFEDNVNDFLLDHQDDLILTGMAETLSDQFQMLTVKYCGPCSYLEVSLDISQDTICLGAPAFTLSGGSPAGGIYSGDGVNNNMFDPSLAGFGEHQIIYTYDDGSGCVKSDSQMVIVDVCTGDQFNDSGLRLEVFPNPFTDHTTIQFFLEKNNELKIELQDLNGRSIKTIAEGNYEAGSHQFNFFAGTLSKGMYLLNIITDSESFRKKVVIQ